MTNFYKAKVGSSLHTSIAESQKRGWAFEALKERFKKQYGLSEKINFGSSSGLYVENLTSEDREILGDKLHKRMTQGFYGVYSKYDIAKDWAKQYNEQVNLFKLFSLQTYCWVVIGYIGKCEIVVKKSGDVMIMLDGFDEDRAQKHGLVAVDANEYYAFKHEMKEERNKAGE